MNIQGNTRILLALAIGWFMALGFGGPADAAGDPASSALYQRIAQTGTAPLPPGSYRGSCTDCSMDKFKTLSCSCKTVDSPLYNQATLDTANCKEPISNCNGQLTCGSC